MISIGGIDVRGAAVDAQGRCVHYRSAVDLVALRFHCCGDWYPCFRCHDEAVAHERTVWPAEDADAVVALCGVCGSVMSRAAYQAVSACPSCGAAFNPRCELHHDLYFG
ncbi:CHY zinc finger protein [uncultured Microbacterium sp.]|uniref:CHY zinc finger protein n=1 Tax=uncultured Microbacterium sp. TaxID=191216 RepID=UPI00261989CC|nr:CHY zinc finger protein [uncultured Microbacterium sp.]